VIVVRKAAQVEERAAGKVKSSSRRKKRGSARENHLTTLH
jgi:hypothetical protein